MGSHAGVSSAVGLLGEPVRWGAPATPGRRSRRSSGAASAMSFVSEGNTPPTKSRLRMWRRRSKDFGDGLGVLRSPPSRLKGHHSRGRSRSPSRRASSAVIRNLGLGEDEDEDVCNGNETSAVDGVDVGGDASFEDGFFVVKGGGGSGLGDAGGSEEERQRRRTEAARASERRRRKLARAEKRRGLSPGALRASERYNQGAQVPREREPDAQKPSAVAVAVAVAAAPARHGKPALCKEAMPFRPPKEVLRKEAMPFRPPMRAVAVAVNGPYARHHRAQ